jgi:hypothetical protein
MRAIPIDDAVTLLGRVAPGFSDLLLDRANRPFERKIRKVERLRYVDIMNEDIWMATGSIIDGSIGLEYPSSISIRGYDQVTKDQTVPEDIAKERLTHVARMHFFPVRIRPHAMVRWRERSYDTRPGEVNALEYDIAQEFHNEFKLRGKPQSKWCGLPVDDGIFLGEWRMVAELLREGIGRLWLKEIQLSWRHNSRRNKNIIVSSHNYADDDYVFLANTFISWSDCSFNQAKLGKQYLEDPENMAQKFRRGEHTEEWTPSKNPNITKNTPRFRPN